MRLLLIAYEFPPSPSPQSLRWAYLARELDALGHEVHVLAPELGGVTPGLPVLPPTVSVHRCFAGPFRGFMAFRRNRKMRTAQRVQSSPDQGPIALRPPRNWKQRISEVVQKTLEAVIYPDLRGEWKPWAKAALHELLDRLHPDVVISSHEPATTLELGMDAKARGYRWVVDLGDPVMAGYTPRRWRRRATRIERDACLLADLIIVTNEAVAQLLWERHGSTRPSLVLTQGFDLLAQETLASGDFDERRLELFYSGSLYRFRRIDELLVALEENPKARLNLASVTVPERLLDFASKSPHLVRLMGFLPHESTLALQRQAHMLVNIANEDNAQVPGKIFEYLGSGRPILHMGMEDDSIAELLRKNRRGWVCRNDAKALSSQLSMLVLAHTRGELEHGLELGPDAVSAYSWQASARRLDAELHALQRNGA